MNIQSIKNFFSVPKQVYCRLEMPRNIKKTALGKNVIAETNKVFAEISQENLRSYFIVSLKKEGYYNLTCRLINDDFTQTATGTHFQRLRKMSKKSAEETQDYVDCIGKLIREQYNFLKEENKAEKELRG